VFVTELGESQRTLGQIEDRNRRLLLQSARMVSTSPTLRAALDAWRGEDGRVVTRAQRVATITRAVARTFQGLDVDLLVITDDSGRVVTVAGNPGPTVGSSLRSLPAVRSALFGQRTVVDSAFGVLDGQGVLIEIAAVPILIKGFAVGGLLLGARVDRMMPADAQFETRRVVASDRMVLISSLESAAVGTRWRPQWSPANGTGATLVIGGEDYVTATLSLGAGQDGRPVHLYLLRSLTAAIDPVEAALTRRFLLAGLLATLLAGAGGAALSGTTLRPLARFVTFVQSGTGTDSYARFDEPHAPREISALTDSYNHLIASLERDHEQLQLRTVDLAKVNHRLNRQITQRERAEQALRESEEQLRQAQKLEALGALAGGVAHDFNNILAIILGYAEIVQAELPPGSAQQADVTRISDAAVRARTLVRQLLAFSRKQVLQPQVLDLNQVVEGVQPLLERLVGADVELAVRLAPDLACVMADPGQIEQVIMNLAVNARDAMPNGGKLLIETANTAFDAQSGHHPLPGGPVVMLAVTDTGIGMDAATRQRIFEPFFTTKPVGQGTGLGLATVYGIIRQSEGNITVFSAPGEGSAFRCYFPPAIASKAVQPVAPGHVPVSRGAETILLAEDEPELRQLLRRSLQRQGYTVLEAEDGEAALVVAANHRDVIHMLVTDVIMPHLSGRDLAERLLKSRPATRVLFMSGYSDDAIERHGMLMPDSRLLQKPVSPEVLLHAVRELLDGDLTGHAVT
ncbi:MAG: response regulator, partial [Gemmatimonadales bacterium]